MPLSLIPTFLVLSWLGYALSNITLLGLTLVVGVLVDDAIVEIENIVRHLRTHPERGAWRAAMDASAEIGLAVMATTGAILAVFVPVAFMPGIPGQFFRQFGLTVAAAVTFSLIVARMLTPLMGAYLLKPTTRAGSEEVGDGRIGRRYLALLGWCLRHRKTTLAGATGFFALSVALVPLIPSDFIPAADRGRSAMALELAPGATLADTDAAVRRATAILRDAAGGRLGLRLARHRQHRRRGPRHGQHHHPGRPAQRQPHHHPGPPRRARADASSSSRRRSARRWRPSPAPASASAPRA